jgi:hypothetical protein
VSGRKWNAIKWPRWSVRPIAGHRLRLSRAISTFWVCIQEPLNTFEIVKSLPKCAVCSLCDLFL